MGNKIRSIPPRKWRFIGEQNFKKQSGVEDPEKDMNEFKKKLRDRASKRK